MCKPRVTHAPLAADAAFLVAAAGAIQKTESVSKIDGLEAAIGVLFANYTISVTDNKPDEQKLTEIAEQCAEDLVQFGPEYYGIGGHPTAGVAGFAVAIYGLWDAINSIITPIAIAAGQAVDDVKRAKAVRAYLTKNQDVVAAAVRQLGVAVNNFARSQRLQAAGAFAERLAVIRGTTLNISEQCKAPLASTPSSPPSNAFMKCYSLVGDDISDNVAAALKSADQYDQFADAGYGLTAQGGGDPKLVADVIKQLDAAIQPSTNCEISARLGQRYQTAQLLRAIAEALAKSNANAF